MIKTGIIGATGYAGAELVRILAGHPEADIGFLTSRQYEGTPFSDVYPGLKGQVDTKCERLEIDAVPDDIDCVFTALPHRIPMSIVPELIRQGKRVVDLSADFRFSDAARYESHYQPHSAKDLLDQAVYGLSEVYADKIGTAKIIGNPGCYPTSTLLPLIPMIQAGLIDPGTIIVDSKSGVSGAGRSPSLGVHFCEVHESFKAYKVTGHRHTPEMEEVLSNEAVKPVTISFTPHLVPMSRGMMTTIYAQLVKEVTSKDIEDRFRSFYAGKRFVRICSIGQFPETRHVRGSNYCNIGFHVDSRNQRLVLISAIDNLVKGAAGQAVQNMNIMFGLDEKTGLDWVSYSI